MSQVSGNNNSCVETPAAPEWLSKLETRREALKHGKLGHEVGAGAPCNECKEKCSGLDLHFWRKVCRNCKCRKDQHMCTDNELSGWAQFEILGQIRSKPAYIKIKALASQPVQLEWIPPNAAPDVVSDYMENLGTSHIPVSGSNAANKRKQQLEYQVPRHDLDASLCDNLTDVETTQMEQYVRTLRDQCVGQGLVIRIGNMQRGVVGFIPNKSAVQGVEVLTPEYVQIMEVLGESPVQDASLIEVLSSKELARAIATNKNETYLPQHFIAHSKPFSNALVEFDDKLSRQTKEKLVQLNEGVVQSLLCYAPIYDKLLATLKHKNLNIVMDPKLGPIADFRKEYLTNPDFKADIDMFCKEHALSPETVSPFNSNMHMPTTPFNSPIPLKQNASRSMQMFQDTPMRSIKFGSISKVITDIGLPLNIDYEQDPVFTKIVKSEPLKRAVESAGTKHGEQSIVVSSTPPASFEINDLGEMTQGEVAQLRAFGVDSHLLKSAVLNAPQYGRLFGFLQEKNIEYGDCKLLNPLKKVHDWLMNDQTLFNALEKVFDEIQKNLKNSNSSDSGFQSTPSTPNYANILPEGISAGASKDTTIPGHKEMTTPQKLHNNFSQLSLKDDNVQANPIAVLNCRGCKLPINFGQVAVKAERAGVDFAWHPACFKCETCQELLADLVYFFHNEHIYCGRDLALKLKIPRCKACDELIFTKEYTAAEGASFHIKHFCCYQCDIPLAGQQYVPDDKCNMPLCLPCYDKYYAVSCQLCKRTIGPTDQGVAWGDIHWHGTCFICAGLQCSKSLIGSRFCVKENMPFCSPACVRSIL